MSADGNSAAAGAGASAELDTRMARSRFRLIGAAVDRMLITHRLVDLFAAWMLWRLGAPALAVGWLVVSTALHGTRWWQLRRWRRSGALDHAAADRVLDVHCLLQGMSWTMLLVLAFVHPVGPEHYALSVLFMGVAVDAVFTSGWRPTVFARWAIPAGIALVGGWAWRGGEIGVGLSVLGVGYLLALHGYAKAQTQALRRRVGLTIENEQLTDKLRIERDRAEAASQSRTRFLASGSHDLRQPLHALSINATTLSLLARRLANPVLSEVSESIGRSLRQSNAVLDGLLDISRLDAGLVRAEPVDLSLSELLDELRTEWAPTAAQRGLALHIHIQPGATRLVHTDTDLLARLLRHVVGNALKFTVRGEVRITAEAEGDEGLLLRIDDTGPGIPVQDHERVFEEFSQLGNPSRDRSQGLGLGLAIARRLATLLGATLALRSARGEGTHIELRLPLATPASSPAQAPRQEALPSRQTHPADSPVAAPTVLAAPTEPAAEALMDTRLLDGLRVLAIDDEPEIVRSLNGLIAHLGGDARGAAGRDEAVMVVAGGFRPHLIIADHRLRGHTGLDAIAAVCALTGAVPALLVTGDTAPQALKQAMASGYPVIHKPVDGARLAHALAALNIKRPMAQALTIR